MRKNLLLSLTICMIATVVSAQKYHVVGVERTRLTVDSTYDFCKDNATARFIVPYYNVIDSIMSPVVGRMECAAEIEKPESRMTNLLADIMLWSGELCGEKVDVGVYNIGGIRSPMAAGDVTYGDVMSVSPFENKICFLSLTGEALIELFSQMASTGGECVSKGVKLVFTKDGKLKSAKLNGKDIKPKKKYRMSLVIPILPYLLSFAAGAMIYVVVEELIPEMSQGKHSNAATIFFMLGFSLMLFLDVTLG